MATAQTVSVESKALMPMAKEILSWKELKGDVVIDIGCGSGMSSIAIVNNFRKVKKVIAIDLDADRLQQAKTNFPDRRISYQLADVRKKLNLARWRGKIDKAISVFCFNCLDDDIQLGYENMFWILKPGGEVAFVQSLHSAYYDALRELHDNPRWHEYFLKTRVLLPSSHSQRQSSDYFKKMLEEVGFKVVKICDDSSTYGKIYNTMDECMKSVYDVCQLTNILPEHEREDFMKDVDTVFQKYISKDKDGRIRIDHSTFSAFLRKPGPDVRSK